MKWRKYNVDTCLLHIHFYLKIFEHTGATATRDRYGPQLFISKKSFFFYFNLFGTSFDAIIFLWISNFCMAPPNFLSSRAPWNIFHLKPIHTFCFSNKTESVLFFIRSLKCHLFWTPSLIFLYVRVWFIVRKRIERTHRRCSIQMLYNVCPTWLHY